LLAYSSDGINWTASSSGNTYFTGGYLLTLAWNGSMWLAGGGNGPPTNSVAYSYDGINWTGSSSGNSYFSVSCDTIAWNGLMWVAGGRNESATNHVAYSYDGINWTGSSSGNAYFSGGKCLTISWNGSIWLAGGFNSGNTHAIAYSSDGNTWIGSSSGNSIFSGQCNAIAWNGSRWVAGGFDNTDSGVIGYSSDGITWTASSSGSTYFSGPDGQCYAITWNGVVWIAGGSNNLLTNLVAYSTDNGVTWTASSSANSLLNGYCYSLASRRVLPYVGLTVTPTSFKNIGISTMTFSTIVGASDSWISTNYVNVSTISTSYINSVSANITSADISSLTTSTISTSYIEAVSANTLSAYISSLTTSTITTNNIQFQTTNTVIGNTAVVEGGGSNIAIGYGVDIKATAYSNAVGIGSGIYVSSQNSVNIGYFNIGAYPSGANIGTNTICIGNNIGANANVIGDSNIVLNATQAELGTGGTVGGLFINPVRSTDSNVISTLMYNSTTKEISYRDGRYFSSIFVSSLTDSTGVSTGVVGQVLTAGVGGQLVWGTPTTFSTFTISSIMTPTNNNDNSYNYSLPWVGVKPTTVCVGSVIKYDFTIPLYSAPYAGLPLLAVGGDYYGTNDLITFTTTGLIDKYAIIAVQILKF